MNSNFDVIYSEFNGNIEDANIDTAAAITVTKIAGTAATLSTAQTITGVKTFDEELILKENATPSTPSSTYRKLYFKSDGLLYGLDSNAIEAPIGGVDGWTKETNTLVYASASTFTIAGVDLTTKYTPGTRVKFTQTTSKYFVVVSSTFSTDTTVTVAVNTDYTIANAAITLPYFSYQASPQGYPGVFNYTPTFTGFSGTPTSVGKYMIVGNAITVHINNVASTSNSTSFSVTLPVAVTNLSNYIIASNGQGQDNSAGVPVYCYAVFSSTSLVCQKTAGTDASWTGSGNKSVNVVITYQF